MGKGNQIPGCRSERVLQCATCGCQLLGINILSFAFACSLSRLERHLQQTSLLLSWADLSRSVGNRQEHRAITAMLFILTSHYQTWNSLWPATHRQLERARVWKSLWPTNKSWTQCNDLNSDQGWFQFSYHVVCLCISFPESTDMLKEGITFPVTKRTALFHRKPNLRISQWHNVSCESAHLAD